MHENFSQGNYIPLPVREAVTVPRESELSKSFEYSATVLTKSPRQVQLEKRNPELAKRETFKDLWYSFLGDAVHSHIEKKLKGNKDYILEKRIIRFDKPEYANDSMYRRVGARFDAYHKPSKTLSDHKTTTTYIHGKEMKEEWYTQLMINAYFLMEEGYEVDWLAINAIYMDWRDQRVKYSAPGEYPVVPTAEFKIPCPPKEEIRKFYLEQLEKHITAEKIESDLLPECSEEYCWGQPSVFAVYLPGAGRAKKLCSTEDEAWKYISDKKLLNAQVEERVAQRKRCEFYCAVSSVCNQYQIWKNKQSEKVI